IGRLTTAVGDAGAIVTALDVVDSDHVRVVADVTCDTSDSSHAAQVTAALERLDGVDVRKVSDRTFLLHLGGKIEVTPKVALRNIPGFHDDQHGTAICVLAALTNALRVVGKELSAVRVVVSGAGAAGTAIMKLLLRQGVGDVIAYDRPGALHRGMADLGPAWS